MMHVSFRLLLGGKLAMAPFRETPRYVLDVGTGTGIWAIQFGECLRFTCSAFPLH
jgi:ubiquinone/menaquinone biosynthesis C-methylase UbiE